MDQLAELRERRALTLRELAEMSGVAADTINQIELGHRKPRPSTLRKLARALGVDVEELMPPKGAAPSTPGQPEEKISIEERHARYLRAWRGFVWKLIHRWEADPPKTSREIAVILDTMQAIVDEGAFGLPPGQITTSNWREASEGIELQALFLGLQRLNDIADTVKGDETAQQRRELLEALPGGLSA
jgi:transcriptional regulator with XRE-family HTH domain